ncbi:MAG: hypothetical protein PUB32_07235 [Clostridiales bacterium]|nr:hypothetical protein [Clostridiales bacterium]
MNTKKSKFKKLIIALAVVLAVLLAVFLIGRYGWKLGGFNACQSAGIESVEVTDGQVRITGFYPGSFPEGFLGCHAEEKDGRLYVGFKFSSLFGIFETGDFDITIPTKGEIKEVIVKTGADERSIWNASEQTAANDTENRVPSPADKPGTMEAYATVIGEYYTALAEGWDAERLIGAGLNYMVAESHHGKPLEEIGYTVTDLDGDGTAELAIGSMVEDDFFGKMIFTLYTLDDEGVPLLLFDSTERNRYYYAGGFKFANLGSSDWQDSFVTTLKLEDKEMIDMTYTTEPEDYVQMNLTPFLQWVK